MMEQLNLVNKWRAPDEKAEKYSDKELGREEKQ